GASGLARGIRWIGDRLDMAVTGRVFVGIKLNAFVTRLFQELETFLKVPPERKGYRPRTRKCLRIRHRRAVINPVRADGGPTLDDMQGITVIVARAVKPSHRAVVGDVDHQSIALPLSSRIAHPQGNILAHVRSSV